MVTVFIGIDENPSFVKVRANLNQTAISSKYVMELRKKQAETF